MMKQKTVKNLTEAHGWLGIIISGILFCIFFAGSISLFRPEIFLWSVAPTHKISDTAPLSLSEVIAKVAEDKTLDPEREIGVLKEENSPYYSVYLYQQEGGGKAEQNRYLMNAKSGEIIGETNHYFLSEFIYALHESLSIPAGKYIVGLVTLIFLIILLSGIFIHYKKLAKQFFQYRPQSSKKEQMLDMHKVIGVISLPFTLMYAITGLVFTLVIIYQIAFALVLYKGDQKSLLKDAGVYTVSADKVNIPMTKGKMDSIIEELENHYGNGPRFIRVFNYGDQSAVLQTLGDEKGKFGHEYDAAFNLYDGSEVFRHDSHQYSAVRYGSDVMEALHYGKFAGIDIKLIYYVLGMMVCGLIVTGNFVWIEKRAKSEAKENPKSVKILYPLTLTSTLGLMFSICLIFLAERCLPPNLGLRADLLVGIFLLSLTLCAIASVQLDKSQFTNMCFSFSSAVLILAVVLDWLMYSDNLKSLWQAGYFAIFKVESGMVFMSLLFAYCAHWSRSQITVSELEYAEKS